MSGLWRKELRSMLPFLSLAVLIPAFGVAYEMLTGLPNMKPWGATYGDYVISSREGSVFVCLFTLALASGLLVREYDEGTMEFLDALPVTRSRVFVVKLTMAMGVVMVLIVLDASTTLLLHAFSRTSLERSFHWQFWFTAIGMRMCQAFVVLSAGIAFSFLRRFGWLLIGLMVWAYLLLHELTPAVAVLDVLALSRPQFEGQVWLIPYRMLWVQLAMGGLLLAAAFGLFLGAGDAFMRRFRRLTQSRLGSAFLLSGSLLLGIVAFSLFFYLMENDSDTEEAADIDAVKIEYPSWSTSRARSRHYEFMFPTNLSRSALPLVGAADDVHETVRLFFGADPGESIVVDATNMLPRHAGLAYWNKILLDLTTTEELETLKSILGHETAHIYLERLSDSRLAEQFSSTRLFHEGVATYIEYRLFEPAGSVEQMRRVAAVMRDRDEVHFEELVDNARLIARRDGNLVYSLGEVFVTELVERHGEEAIGKIVRALVRDDAPENLSGLELWRDVFQACGYNLEAVLDDFYARLDAERERYGDFVDSVPRLWGAVESDEDFVTVRVVWDAAEPWQPVCRFRQYEDTPERSYMIGIPFGPDTFGAWRHDFPSSTLWYQLGLADANGTIIFETWTQIQLND